MTRDERTISRILFQKKIHEADGQKFEDLFSAIMNYKEPDFTQIKPWGNIGDRKNDGCILGKGIYFQVHAPEDVKKSYHEIIKKIQTDFSGLQSHWGNIQEFYYVLNDKYKGVNADALQLLETIKQSNSLKECKFIRANDLENMLYSLDDDQIMAITGHIPDPANLASLDYGILNEILDHLKGKPLNNGIEKIVAPDWDEKINFNNLSINESVRLTNGYFQLGTLNEYLKNNSDFTAQELQNKISAMYQELAKSYSGSELFWELVSEVSPRSSAEYQASSIVIMSMYFETCDIFEEPVQ
ncbi:MAG TPA: ABC-three component system protein [Sulfurimonas sp.]|uniref:ABC-three component system protein n=1 Tax=Sulfurimonas sp. TaxID=2022749 RepID=UPI002BA8F9DE|nr:ABC-three component system protein [Sulfurimonas sp.]HUH42001.1 ABC-three component system protein [Sulfurimonas sp.]